ncbi:hypothetical protein LCGC14_1546970 [marine sediment metagenome]|uniref:Uncharacterized protein n=1 Tax=marine sediment metagenome TaxID=412755 RepID=A0A0F9IRC6_9ZZZZ
MKKKITIPLIVSAIIAGIVIALLIVFLPSYPRGGHPPQLGEKKAIILGSANDYYRKDDQPDFNFGNQAKFNDETNNWTVGVENNMYGAATSSELGHDGLPGVLRVFKGVAGYGNWEFIFNWTDFYPLYESAAYFLSAWVNISISAGGYTFINPPNGVRIGLRWLNSSDGVVRTDWSNSVFETPAGWILLNVTSVNNNSIGYEITRLQLVLAVEGNMNGNELILFDDITVQHWTPPPISIPIPSQIDADGFPAQALQVYWILKNHSYSDNNIFFMLYHTNDTDININATDGIGNDLAKAVIDVENDNVNASRFMQELNVSFSGSFASEIGSNDELIIFITDHGSNSVLGDGNATFHFEADDSFITETEFINLVQQISSKSMLINIDMCFSGNFLNENSNIGSSWYNLPNTPDFILITSSADSLSWYWRDNTNADGFAGSWFFHQF